MSVEALAVTAFIACCVAFVAVLVVGEVRWQATRQDRFDVWEEGDE